MSRKWQVIWLCVLVTVVSIGVHDYLGHRVRVACAAAPGSEPSILAQLQSSISLLIAAMGGVGGIVAFLHKWVDEKATPKQKVSAVTALDIGSMAVYADLFAKSKNAAEREANKTAAKALNDDLFNQWFTIPATEVKS